MLELMPQGIVALPVHDSFLVRQDFLPQLRAAMLKVRILIDRDHPFQ